MYKVWKKYFLQPYLNSILISSRFTLKFVSSKFYLRKLWIEITWQTLYADITNINVCVTTSSRIQPLIVWDIVKTTIVTTSKCPEECHRSKIIHRSKKPALIVLTVPNSIPCRRIPTYLPIYIPWFLICAFTTSIGNYIYRLAITDYGVWKNYKKYQ